MFRIFSLPVRVLLFVICCWCGAATANTAATNTANQAPVSVPILVYHQVEPSKPGSMTISTAKFAAQMKYLKDNHYTVIPLQTLVNYLEGKGPPPPPKSVVITADDGRESVYTNMWPILKQYNYPVTLFIYPSVISNASYAMTWQQLAELKNTGMFDIQGHTYWHPNFKQEKKRLSPEEYQKLVNIQLEKSKGILDKKLGINVTLLAWPFGIYDDYLEQEAAKAGYTLAFSIDGRNADKSHKMLAQPRYMIVESQNMNQFAAIVSGGSQKKQQLVSQK